MPTVAPQARPTADTSRTFDDVSKESLSSGKETSSLRKLAGIAALSMALTNSENASAQSPITPTPPPGYAPYVHVQKPDGTFVAVPVVSSIPQGYTVAPGPTQLPTYSAPQAPVAQSNVPASVAPQAPSVGAPSQAPAQPYTIVSSVPSQTSNTSTVNTYPGAVPQGEVRVVYPGGAQGGGVATQVVAPQAPTAAPPVLTGPGYNATIPSVAQAQMDYSAARMRAHSQGLSEMDQARLNLEAARLAEQQQIRATREAERQAVLAQREQMRYNADAQRYHYRRAQDIGWVLDSVLPSDVPGPWVKPVPPRQPR